MTERLLRNLFNASSVLCAALILVVLVVRYTPRPNSPRTKSPARPHDHTAVAAGTVVGIPGLDLSKSERTLLMVLDVGCVWGAANARFYREILAAPQRGFEVIGVLPQSNAEARRYLDSIDLGISRVFQKRASDMGVRSYPSLVLVDSREKVIASWAGTLSATERIAVRQQLGMTVDEMPLIAATNNEGGALTKSAVISAPDLGALMSNGVVPLVDIRPRSYASFAGAIRMPVDEVRTRALHELPVDGLVVLACGECPACQTDLQEQRLRTPCWAALMTLRDLGFQDVRLLVGDPLQLNVRTTRKDF